MRNATTVLALGLALGLAGCEADRETFEAGGTLEAPPAVEQAPAVPFPSTEETTRGLEGPGVVAPLPPTGTDGATMPADSASLDAPQQSAPL